MISNKFNPNSILHLATLHTVCDVIAGESLRSVSRVLANGKFVQHGVSRTFEHGWTDVVRARLNLIYKYVKLLVKTKKIYDNRICFRLQA
jgi:hypothetical protein